MVSNAALYYKKPPHGAPVPGETLQRVVDDNFDVDNVPLNGGILVQSKALSLDPYMRGRLRDPAIKSYNQPFELNKPIVTLGVGVVLRSDDPSIKPGQIFKGLFDLAEYAVVPPALVKIGRVIENEEQLPWTTLVGAAGMPGATAWIGLYDIGKPKKGETIFGAYPCRSPRVGPAYLGAMHPRCLADRGCQSCSCSFPVSAASGAVGQIVGQLAKRDGLFTIGSAGTDEKVAFLKEIGYDVAFNCTFSDSCMQEAVARHFAEQHSHDDSCWADKTESTQKILEQHAPDLFWCVRTAFASVPFTAG